MLFGHNLEKSYLEKEVEIETGILEFILVTVGVQGGHGTKLQ
jgi:hypothetical protein